MLHPISHNIRQRNGSDKLLFIRHNWNPRVGHLTQQQNGVINIVTVY